MIAGRFPFHGMSEYLTWQKIKGLEYSFPDGFDEDAKDLVQKLLVSITNGYVRQGTYPVFIYRSLTPHSA